MNKAVVVTGIGVVSPYGVGLERFWSSVAAGQCAIKAWQPEGVENFPVSYAATIDVASLKSDFPHCFPERGSIERRAVFGLIAAELAMQDAGVSRQALGNLGISVCSGVPDADDATLARLSGLSPENAIKELIAKRDEVVNYYGGFRCSNDVLATELALRHDCTGPVINVNGACAGATQAIGLGYKSIQRGESSAVLVGGGDSVFNIRTLSALISLGATATSKRFGEAICRPFDEHRAGLVPGEGAAILLLEEKSAAEKRGAKIYCEIAGYGSSLDAYKVTAPHPEGTGAKASMRNAINNAGLRPQDIGYINAHGTSTPLNDVIESEAIEEVFGEYSHNGLLVSATKSLIGHWIASAGAPEAVATIMALKHQQVPPTINLAQADERCRLDYVAGKKRPAKLNFGLSNSFGFGGINASLIFGRYAGE